jgi:tellurite resistance protein TerC
MIDRFAYLKYALAAVLIFIGSKIIVADMIGIAKVPPAISLGTTFAILAVGVFYSLWKTRDLAKAAPFQAVESKPAE